MQLLKNWVNHSSDSFKDIYGIWCSFKKIDSGIGVRKLILIQLTETMSDIHLFNSELPKANMTSFRRFVEENPKQITEFISKL